MQHRQFEVCNTRRWVNLAQERAGAARAAVLVLLRVLGTTQVHRSASPRYIRLR